MRRNNVATVVVVANVGIQSATVPVCKTCSRDPSTLVHSGTLYY